ncbi:hypothetical protein ACVNS2_17180 [Paenibacillus caseinilyticus]|uniref:Uncharacterized protein n=1 Tax=Paenibacillus mucilaginosus K02 TaxID=997761 RepID=I0BJ32_9BACL|nr:hypothetical protein [Paenibacillus mucilaginosus]AFH62379.1 hypothetical protein B2K_16905 [Paenibacillus mucilaginosus K02]
MPPLLQLVRRAAVCAAALYMVGSAAGKLLEGQSISIMDLFLLALVLHTLLNTFTWNSMEEERDERGRTISTESAAFSYHVLLVLLLLMFIVDLWLGRRNGEFVGNVPLFVVLCAALILQPVVEWWKARKHR